MTVAGRSKRNAKNRRRKREKRQKARQRRTEIRKLREHCYTLWVAMGPSSRNHVLTQMNLSQVFDRWRSGFRRFNTNNWEDVWFVMKNRGRYKEFFNRMMELGLERVKI